MQTDPKLGGEVHARLLERGIETPMLPKRVATVPNEVSRRFADILTYVGLDLSDDSLQSTPARVAKMYLDEVFIGLDYNNFPACTTVMNRMQYKEMIAVCDISVMSFCEHHLVPFIGTADVAYIPQDKIMGLSKFNRLVNFFSRRPQIQERLTEQIVAALQHILGSDSVACVIRADHLCVRMRGVRDVNSYTVTSRLGGKFFTEASLRAEFLALSNGGTKR